MEYLFSTFCAIFGSCYALFLGGVGIFLIIFALSNKQDDEKCRTWLKSEGIIIENAITREVSPKGKVCYIPVVQYIFQANHCMIQGSDIHPGPPTRYLHTKKAQQMLEYYPTGRKVWVFYNPKNPQEAVLERSRYNRTHCYIMGSIFIVLMILMLGLITAWWFNENEVVFELFIQ